MSAGNGFSATNAPVTGAKLAYFYAFDALVCSCKVPAK